MSLHFIMKWLRAIFCSIKEQSQEIIDSIKEGAVIIHVHPRDPRDGVAK